jgi:flagellar basal body P-ring formation protein FlgA
MVLWSYLLLGLPVSASLERVLAPLALNADDAPATGCAVDSDVDDVAAKTTADAQPVQHLVEPGADELDLLAELERQLADKLQPAGRLRLIPVSSLPRLPRSVELPDVELLEHPARLATASILLRYRLLDGGRPLSTHATSFRVQVLAEVWVPVRRLSTGATLQSADVVAREVDLVRESKAVRADPAVFGRYELARAASPDRALLWGDLAPRALVRKGHIVDVVAQEGLLTVSMKGQATRSGALGEVVVIRNLESKREFSAEVIDEDKVRVHF